MGRYGDSIEHACPRCNAAPGEPCKNRTRSYRRGWPLERPHRDRLRWAKAITGGLTDAEYDRSDGHA